MRKIGIIFQAMPGLTDEEYVQEMVKHGFQTTFSGVYGWEKHKELTELFDRYGIECETLHAPFNHINDMWLDCEGGNQLMDELKESLQYYAVGDTVEVTIMQGSVDGYEEKTISVTLGDKAE